ncbi:MAG: hypothetical protein WC789_07050 [Lentisphaeria bacterium]
MAPSTIFFNGRLISRPGAYSEIDASGLEAVGLGASGIVAVLGEAAGGIPHDQLTTVDDIQRFTKPEAMRAAFRSGPLREVADMLFGPSQDPDIRGGAQQVVTMKVNPARASTGVLPNAYGNALDLTSRDYGEHTKQITMEVATGTNKGKLLTVTLEDDLETWDDVGGDAIFQLQYTNSGLAWETMTAGVASDGDIVCAGTRADAGLDAEINAQLLGNSVLHVVSSDAGDVGMDLVAYGLNAAGAAQQETIRLTGTTIKSGLLTFSKVYGAKIIGTTAGNVTIKDSTDVTLVLTVAAGANPKRALQYGQAMYVSGGAVTVVAGAASVKNVVVAGLSPTGAAQVEKLTLNGVVPVVGAALWSKVTELVLGDVAAATTVTTSAEVARANSAVQNTLQKAADYFNARYDAVALAGFTWTMLTGLTAMSPTILDITIGGAGVVSCLTPANPSFYADLWACQYQLDTYSQMVSAEISAGAVGGAPLNTATPVFLDGGTEGTTAFADWQAALNWLKQVRVNSVVVLTGDPAVHAALDAHCAYCCGVGRSERDGFVGLLNAGLTDVPTKAQVKSQIVDLNSRHIRASAQAIQRYDSVGERTEFMPYYLAACLAGMQAGSPVGTPLTRKLVNVLSLRQDASWNPVDDAEELIQAGLCFLEQVDGVGRRVVRNVTTHLSTANLAFTEGSVNEAVNYAAYTYRTGMEVIVGQKGFAGTVNAAIGNGTNLLGLLSDELVITSWRSQAAELLNDMLEMSVELSPVMPINFVPITIHLANFQLTA